MSTDCGAPAGSCAELFKDEGRLTPGLTTGQLSLRFAAAAWCCWSALPARAKRNRALPLPPGSPVRPLVVADARSHEA